MATWGFFSYHALVLTFIARNPRGTVREIAASIGMTERATLTILRDLKHAGIITSRKIGRRNAYAIDLKALARHRPWAATGAPIPESFIDAAVRALTRIVEQSRAAS